VVCPEGGAQRLCRARPLLGAQPLGEPQLYNVTLSREGGAGSGSDVLNTRSEYYGQIHNSVFHRLLLPTLADTPPG